MIEEQRLVNLLDSIVKYLAEEKGITFIWRRPLTDSDRQFIEVTATQGRGEPRVAGQLAWVHEIHYEVHYSLPGDATRAELEASKEYDESNLRDAFIWALQRGTRIPIFRKESDGSYTWLDMYAVVENHTTGSLIGDALKPAGVVQVVY